MSVNTTTRAKFSFKKLLGKSHISNGVQFYSESRPNQVWIDSTEIVSKNIPKDPQQAVNDGLVEFVEADLSVIGASNGVGFDVLFPSDYNGFFGTSAQGDPIRDHTQIIDQKNNIDDGKAVSSHNGGYVYALEDSNGNTISVGAPEGWLLDPVSTVLTSQQKISDLDGGTVKVYVYTGQTLREELDSISTGEGFQGTTDDIVEGSTNLYFTDERAQDAALNAVTGTNGLTWTYDDAADSAEVTLSDLDSFTTDDLSEGSSSLYFTDERAQDAAAAMITGGTNISTNYDDGTDTFTINAPDEDVQDAVYNNVLSGEQTRITVTYDDANNEVDFVVDDDISNFDLSNVTTDDISEGSSNLYYTDTRVKNDFQAGGDINYSKNQGTGGYDFSSASFNNTSFDVSGEDANPTGVTFNDDGSKMFVVGRGNDSVYEYDLTTGFDISTASFSQSFDVSTEESTPRDVAFNGDGTKMFVAGKENGSVYEYDLTTGFDLSTASYSGQSFDVSTEDTNPTGVAFNGGGTKMFLIGTGSDSVYEYDLTTGFDLSTASFSSTSFGVSSEDADARDVAFNGDGTKMIMIGTGSNNVYEFDLTTGFDISTASYSGTSFDVGTEDTDPTGVTFNGDGTKMFVVGDSNNTVYSYSTGSTLSAAEFALDVSSLSASDLFGSKTTDDLPEGSSNLYFTNERVDDRVGNLLVGGTNITLNYDDAADTLTINTDDVTIDFLEDGSEVLADVSDANFRTGFDLSDAGGGQINVDLDLGEKTTDDLPEGSTNLYYTDERAQDAAASLISGGTNVTTNYDDANDTFTINVPDEDIQDSVYNNVLSGTQTRITVTYDDANNEVDYVVDGDLSNYNFTSVSSDDISEGSTNLYFTDERAQDAVGNIITGSGRTTVTYDDPSGSITVETTDEAIQDAVYNNVLSGTQTLITVTYDDANNEVDYVVENDLSQYNLSNISSDDISEGSTNLYFTGERVDDRVNNLLVGGSNVSLTYDDAADSLTIDISGTQANLSEDGTQVISSPTDINFTVGFDVTDDGDGTATIDLDLGEKSTDELPEGSTNLYFTDERAQDAVASMISGGTNVTTTYDDATDTFTINVPDENVQDSIFNNVLSGTQTLITVTYDDANNEVDYVVENDLSQYDFGNISSDDISEGSSNLYFTDERAQDAAAAMITGGTNVTTTYDDGTDTFTIDVPDEDVQDAVYNNVLSGTQTLINVTYDDANNEVDFVVESDLSQYNLGNISSDDISEGSTNLYFTEERVDDRVNNLLVGGSNVTLTYDDPNDSLTIDVSGTQANLSEDGAQVISSPTDINFTTGFDVVDDGDGTATVDMDLSEKSTDDLPEGSTNLYFTDERVDDRVSNLLVGGTNVGLTYDDAAGSLTLDVSDENIQDAVFNNVLSGTQTLISVTYDDANNEVDFVVESDLSQYDFGNVSSDDISEGSSSLFFTEERAQDAAASMITGGTNISTSYDDATDTFTIDNDVRFGSATFSGNPPQKEFDISHGLGSKPTSWTITAVTDDASAFSHATADATSITVVYDTVPPPGTDNLELNYSLLV